jgi:hypothetical protein
MFKLPVRDLHLQSVESPHKLAALMSPLVSHLIPLRCGMALQQRAIYLFFGRVKGVRKIKLYKFLLLCLNSPRQLDRSIALNKDALMLPQRISFCKD